MKESKEKIQWDRKKIILFIITLFILLFALYEAKTIVLDKNVSQVQKNPLITNQNVKGAQAIQSPTQDIRSNVSQQINSLRNEASNINVLDIATSSPQVQKIINDLKALQDYPSNQLRETCVNICNRL